MKHHHRFTLAVAVVLNFAGAATWAAFDLSWHTLDAGGGISSGGAFTLSSTVGQPDAGPALSGGGFALVGGFWAHRGTILPSDCDLDGDIDLGDFACFAACMEGPATFVAEDCDPYDFDADGDVDLYDFAEFSTP